MFRDYLNQQNLADHLKRLIIQTRSRKSEQLRDKRQAMQLLQQFERGMWHSKAFEDALTEAGQGLIFHDGKFAYDGENVWQTISAVFENYFARLPKPIRDAPQSIDDVPTMTLEEAAAYLDRGVDMVKTYVNRKGILSGEFKGNTWRFSKRELDRFKNEVMPTLKVGKRRKIVTIP